MREIKAKAVLVSCGGDREEVISMVRRFDWLEV